MHHTWLEDRGLCVRSLILRKPEHLRCETQEGVGKDQPPLQQAEAHEIVLCELTWAQ